jgi:pyruvyl transferase EpsI
LLDQLKSLVPERLKGPILAALSAPKDSDFEPLRRHEKTVLGLAGFYQNLGDMALTYAQKRFLEETLPNHEVLVVGSTATYLRMRALKAVCSPNDVVTLIGGGNMDDLYPSLENCRRFYVRSFLRNPIVSFPQTIGFSDSPVGRRALSRTTRTYARHRRMTIFAREPQSFARMRETFKRNDVKLAPDIVLSLRLDNPPTPRDGALVCIRHDLESAMDSSRRADLLAVVKSHYDDVVIRDTVDVAPEECRPDTYEATLENYWSLLRSRSVMVTDRLHGMIFAAITATPCVVMPNSNHKIRSTYEAWLSDLPHIVFLESPTAANLDAALRRIGDISGQNHAVPSLVEQGAYTDLREALRRAAAGRH